LPSTATLSFTGGTLINQGVVLQNGNLYVYDGALIDNPLDSTWDFQSNGSVGWEGGVAPLFTNEGDVQAGSLISSGLNLPLHNTGTITTTAR